MSVSSMSNLGIVLTSLFSLILLALFSQILYLLWRRRRNHHRKTNRIEPTIPITQPHAPPPLTSNPSFDTAGDQSELLKLESLYGSSRVLFTIKEEAEKEELSENNNVDFTKIDIMNLSERFGEKSLRLDNNNDDHVIFMVGDDEDHYFDVELEPPFLTPCGSPSYFTPSSSPPRDGQ